MEDRNALIADCIVISCCCQCLILQLLVFVFLHLPRKMARKTKKYAMKKLGKRRKAKFGEGDNLPRAQCDEDFIIGRSMRIHEVEGIDHGSNKLHRWGHNNCMDEVEEVLEELSMKGEFAFGSFWGGDFEKTELSCSKCVMINREGLQYHVGGHVVKFHLVEVVGPFNSS